METWVAASIFSTRTPFYVSLSSTKAAILPATLASYTIIGMPFPDTAKLLVTVAG